MNLDMYCAMSQTRLTTSTSVGAGMLCMASTFVLSTFTPSLVML